MINSFANRANTTTGFAIKDKMMRYNVFVPRLYNFCKSLGFEAGKIMPSRAFCSDENQGYPIIMIAKHFGIFPFNHGRVGGIVATDRHGPHAEHGRDLVIIQASHVGYDPATTTFGQYRRMQTEETASTPTCGKICNIMDWYQQEYQFAQDNIFIYQQGGDFFITIDNQLLNMEREEGLILHLNKLIESSHESLGYPVRTLSTARSYKLAPYLRELLSGRNWQEEEVLPIGKYLTSDLFYFKRHICQQTAGGHHLEKDLMQHMAEIITSEWPSLTAAQVTTQVEFDRTYRSIVKEKSFHGKRLVFIAGLNIDISPLEDNIFPLTKFVPWAVYIQDIDGRYRTMEQDELMAELLKQSTDNPEQIDLEAAISAMAAVEEVIINP